MLQVPLAFLSSCKKANRYGLKAFVYKKPKSKTELSCYSHFINTLTVERVTQSVAD